MNIGFTGTQIGMTIPQMVTFQDLLLDKTKLTNLAEQLFESETYWLHHGDCCGADAQAHQIAKRCGLMVYIHPPVIDTLRAFCEGDIIQKPKDYIKRNHDIVDTCQVLIATPKGKEEVRSGTWATVRYAKKKLQPTIIIMPDGRIV